MSSKDLSKGTGKDVLNLSSGETLDLSELSSAAKEEIRAKHANAVLDLKVKAQEAQLDLQSTTMQLDGYTEQVRKASEDGAASTISFSTSNSVGRTEVIMGNTDAAAKGKLSRTAKGESDITMKIVIAVGVFAVIIAAILSSK